MRLTRVGTSSCRPTSSVKTRFASLFPAVIAGKREAENAGNAAQADTTSMRAHASFGAQLRTARCLSFSNNNCPPLLHGKQKSLAKRTRGLRNTLSREERQLPPTQVVS